MRPLSSFLARAGLGAALMLGANQPVAYASAHAVVVEPSEATRSVTVDTSEIPDFDPSLAGKLSDEATKQAEEFGFDPSQITVTIVWLDAATASYGIHVYIETKDAKLSDGPRGPMLKPCEQCSNTRVPEVAIEALLLGFEVYEKALKDQRKRNEAAEEQRRLDDERNREELTRTNQPADEQERAAARRLRRDRIAAATLLSVGLAAHAVGITLMVLWKDGDFHGEVFEGREYYTPGTVLLSLSPAPIAAGAVYLSSYVKAKKKQRATPTIIGVRRGLGLGATFRF